MCGLSVSVLKAAGQSDWLSSWANDELCAEPARCARSAISALPCSWCSRGPCSAESKGGAACVGLVMSLWQRLKLPSWSRLCTENAAVPVSESKDTNESVFWKSTAPLTRAISSWVSAVSRTGCRCQRCRDHCPSPNAAMGLWQLLHGHSDEIEWLFKNLLCPKCGWDEILILGKLH